LEVQHVRAYGEPHAAHLETTAGMLDRLDRRTLDPVVLGVIPDVATGLIAAGLTAPELHDGGACRAPRKDRLNHLRFSHELIRAEVDPSTDPALVSGVVND